MVQKLYHTRIVVLYMYAHMVCTICVQYEIHIRYRTVSDEGRVFSANEDCVAPVSRSIWTGTESAPAVNDT